MEFVGSVASSDFGKGIAMRIGSNEEINNLEENDNLEMSYLEQLCNNKKDKDYLSSVFEMNNSL